MSALLLPLVVADGQSVFSSRGEPYILEQWTVNEGLPQNTVSSLVQTADGFIWLATNGGLVRFDGVQFHTYDRLDPADPRAYRVRALVEGADSSLWIGTEDGQLFRLRGGEFEHVPSSLSDAPSSPILVLGRDQTDVVWLGRDREGLARIGASADGQFTMVQSSLQPEWKDPVVSVISVSQTGSVWLGGGGVAELKGSGIQTHALPVTGAGVLVESLVIDTSGAVWVGTSDRRMYVRRQRTFVELPLSSFQESYAIDEVVLSGRADLEAAVHTGILRFLNGRFHRVGSSAWGRAAQVRSVLLDREENIWIGTVSDGLIRARRAPFSHWSLGEHRPNVTSMVRDPQRGVWVALNCGGVLLVQKDQVVPHPVSTVLAGECVWSLALDSRGKLWAGTWGGGLVSLDPDRPVETFRRFGSASALRSNIVLSLVPRRSGGVWVGTKDAGLVLINGDRIRRWTTNDGLPSDDVRSFVEDSLGRLWIGTQLGAAVLEDSAVRRVVESDNSYDVPVRTVSLDADGSTWFGTYGGGLLRWHRGKMAMITTDQGLADNIVSQFMLDGAGYAWMGSNRGIWKVALQELHAAADGRIPRVTSITYGTGDGLLTLETNGGFSPSGLQLPNGEMWFPTPIGIARTNPATLRANRTPPPVVIERILIDRSPHPARASVVIPAGVEDVRVEFTALSFTAPQKVRFKYQLQGYNKSWVDVADERAATFTNVTPGTYRFRVIAANNDGIWNDDGAEVTLTFEVPYWQTFWFRLLAVLALVGMGMLVVAIRLRQVRQEKERQEETSRRLIQGQEEERQRIAGELHDSLGQDLIVAKNRLLLAVHHLQDGTPAKEELMNVVDAVTAALRSVRSIAYNLRPFQLDRLGLTETIRSTVRAVQQVTPVKIETEIATVDGLLNREAEIGVFRIIQEALTNVVKHSQATRASVVVAYDEGHIVVRVEDNGKGFESPTEGAALAVGFGLSSIEERVKMLGGVHKFSSSVESGTTIAARIPVEGNEPEPAP